MSIWDRLRRRDSEQDRLMRKLDGKALTYVVERRADGTETVLCKDGRLVITDQEIAVFCQGQDAFCCLREGASVALLLSLDGVRIRGRDAEGRERTIVAYYTR